MSEMASEISLICMSHVYGFESDKMPVSARGCSLGQVVLLLC